MTGFPGARGGRKISALKNFKACFQPRCRADLNGLKPVERQVKPWRRASNTKQRENMPSHRRSSAARLLCSQLRMLPGHSVNGDTRV
jgi:hypothetical protein